MSSRSQLSISRLSLFTSGNVISSTTPVSCAEQTHHPASAARKCACW
ncbi:MAG: hypothetical protein U0V48_17065 [Anaerolineales bacterium]